MSRKFLLGAAILASLALIPFTAWAGGTDATNVTVNATVDAFAEWADHAPVIDKDADWDGHITAVNTAQHATKALVIYTNSNVTIAPTAGAHSGILTNGTQTLVTQYKLTGADLSTTADSSWKNAGTASGEFFDSANNAYAITHVSGTGSYTVTLNVQMTSQTNQAPDAGDYTAGLTLTASW
jgi:hypothetical protein